MPAAATVLYLSRDQVRQACAAIEPVSLMREVLCLHASGRTVLPDEAYLAWNANGGQRVRSLNMPAYVGGPINAAGTKIINSNPRNPERDCSRASGLTLLFDTLTGQIVCVMEGAYISALRTASVTLVSIELLAREPVRSMSIIGAGVIGSAHADLSIRRLERLERLVLFDVDARAAEALAGRLASTARPDLAIEIVGSAEEAVRHGDVVVAATTTTSGYIEYGWLKRGSLVVNVSLDDLCPEVFLKADLLFVDDWKLVRSDVHRALGKMFRCGAIAGPGETPQARGPRSIDGEIGDIAIGRHAGRRTPDDIIVVNPFGLGIEDVALARRIFDIATEERIGLLLPV